MINEKASKALLWIGVIILLIGLVIFFWRENITTSTVINPDKVGQFGDFIGGVVGAVWSLAGIILFYVALTEQKKDIKINQEALKAQVEALKKQTEEFSFQRIELEETRMVIAEQSETLRIQRFENTFFHLLNLYHEILEKIVLSDKGKRVAIKLAVSLLRNNIDAQFTVNRQDEFGNFLVSSKEMPKDIVKAEECLKVAYNNFFFSSTSQIFSNYFRHLYHIFKYVYVSDLINKRQKGYYASIVRAQLSSDEMFLIFYNSIVEDFGYPNFAFLVKKYKILDNFNYDLIAKYPFHKEIHQKQLDNAQVKFKSGNKAFRSSNLSNTSCQTKLIR